MLVLPATPGRARPTGHNLTPPLSSPLLRESDRKRGYLIPGYAFCLPGTNAPRTAPTAPHSKILSRMSSIPEMTRNALCNGLPSNENNVFRLTYSPPHLPKKTYPMIQPNTAKAAILKTLPAFMNYSC